MTQFVFVHGGCHGAWCWDALLKHLPGTAIQLPGHGKDVNRAGLDDGIGEICVVLKRIGEPVVLVGHSLGGMAISAAGEAMHEAVSRLIYLSALLPRDGESAASIPLPILGAAAATRVSADGCWTELDPALAPPIFYHDCTPASVARALERGCRTDLDYVTTPVLLTATRFGRVPKSYILCLVDRAIQIEAQRIMVARYPGIGVATLGSGHSPFLSMPDRLASLLLNLA